MAVSSFVVSTVIVAGGVYVYNDKEDIIENVKQQVVDGVAEVLPELVTAAMSGFSMGEDLAQPSVPQRLPF